MDKKNEPDALKKLQEENESIKKDNVVLKCQLKLEKQLNDHLSIKLDQLSRQLRQQQ